MFPTKIMVRGKDGQPTENYIEDKDFFPHLVRLSAEAHNLSVEDYLLRFHGVSLNKGSENRDE